MTEKNKGGRPRKFSDGLVKTMGFRLRPALEAQLRAAAAKEGRSMSEEVEARLRRSFDLEDIREAIRQEFVARYEQAWPMPSGYHGHDVLVAPRDIFDPSKTIKTDIAWLKA